MKEPTARFLSYGAGIDSTTVLLMSQHGELPRLDGVIFADTQSEPQGVYDTLEWVSAAVDIPIHRVSAGNLKRDLLSAAHDTRIRSTFVHGQPPFFVQNMPNVHYPTPVRGGRLLRGCTRDYKIRVIRRKIRELVGLPVIGGIPKGTHIEQWIGFSLDDMGRTFCSDVQWITNTFPLILPKRMRRRDCIAWLKGHGYHVPMKSSCTFCPYHSNTYWREMRDTRPDEWQQTVAFEAELQRGKLPGVRGIPYLHRAMVPLAIAPIDKPDEGEMLFCMACNT